MDEAHMYSGDVYVMQDGEIVGMMCQLKFRQVPRLLMDRFFSAPAAIKSSSSSNTGKAAVPSNKPPPPKSTTSKTVALTGATTGTGTAAADALDARQNRIEKEDEPTAPITSSDTAPAAAESGPVADALRLIATETGLELEDLRDEASFVELGVDSLMSLVLSEKFKSQLNLEVKSSVFLECPSLADLKEYLNQFA